MILSSWAAYYSEESEGKEEENPRTYITVLRVSIFWLRYCSVLYTNDHGVGWNMQS